MTATALRLALSLATTTATAIAIAIALAREIRRQRAYYANRDISEDEFFDLSRYDSNLDIPISATVIALATALVTALVIALARVIANDNIQRSNRNIPNTNLYSDILTTNTSLLIRKKPRYLL